MAVSTTKEQFIEKSNKTHNFKYTYLNVEYKGVCDKVWVTCPTHGDFLQVPHAHSSRTGCPTCAGNNVWTKQRFTQAAEKVHGGRYNYDKVVCNGAHAKVTITCAEHGDFTQSIAAHTRLRQGCPECHRADESLRLEAISVQKGKDFSAKASIVHEGKYDYSKSQYSRSRFNVEIICKEHGSFWQTPNNHLGGAGCPTCQPGGFSSKLPGYVYILVDGDTTKVGITNKTPQQRAGVVNWLGEKNFHVVSAFKFVNGSDARVVEKKLLQYLRQRYSNTELKHHGSTECFVDVVLSDVVAQLCILAVQYETEAYNLGENMFGTMFDIAKDAAKIVVAPVEIALDVVSVPVKAVAEVAEELVKDVKSIK